MAVSETVALATGVASKQNTLSATNITPYFQKSNTAAGEQSNKRKMIKVWTDGCYDMVHFGHANQIRQAKGFGDYLIVGVHTDEEIAKHKGPPVFNEQERYRMCRAIKWVDEIVEAAPYVTTVETLDKYGCEFCVHGDDITLTADGSDTYGQVKAAGRYRECKRTAGVSTTDLVGRMLLMTSRSARAGDVTPESPTAGAVSVPTSAEMSSCGLNTSPWTTVSSFCPSTRQILQFCEGRQPKANDRIVYCPGAFDLFHIGHLAFLEEAAKHGDYLIVGLHDDNTLMKVKGTHHPIQSVHERLLSCLAYKPVCEVVLCAPYTVTEDLLTRFRVHIVCVGVEDNSPIDLDPDTGRDPYAVPKNMGKFLRVDSGNDMTTSKIVDRIIDHRRAFESRNIAKQAKEVAAFNALQRMQQETGVNGSSGVGASYHTVNISVEKTPEKQ